MQSLFSELFSWLSCRFRGRIELERDDLELQFYPAARNRRIQCATVPAALVAPNLSKQRAIAANRRFARLVSSLAATGRADWPAHARARSPIGCLTSPSARAVPTFWVSLVRARLENGNLNGVRIVGAMPYQQFDAKIQELLKQVPTTKN